MGFFTKLFGPSASDEIGLLTLRSEVLPYLGALPRLKGTEGGEARGWVFGTVRAIEEPFPCALTDGTCVASRIIKYADDPEGRGVRIELGNFEKYKTFALDIEGDRVVVRTKLLSVLTQPAAVVLSGWDCDSWDRVASIRDSVLADSRAQIYEERVVRPGDRVAIVGTLVREFGAMQSERMGYRDQGTRTAIDAAVDATYMYLVDPTEEELRGLG